jgi:hypothetical protein
MLNGIYSQSLVVIPADTAGYKEQPNQREQYMRIDTSQTVEAAVFAGYGCLCSFRLRSYEK